METRSDWLRLGMTGAVLFGMCALAQCADLHTLYQAAVGYDPMLKSAGALLRAEEMKYPEARSRWLPSVRASGSAIHGRVDQEASLFPNYRTEGFTFSLSQTIFDWGALQDLHDSSLEVDQAYISFAKSQSDLILRLCDGYFSVLSAQEDKSAAHTHLIALQEQEKLAREGFRLGNGTIVDVRDAEASVAAAQADELDAENALQERIASLTSIVGHPPGELASLSSRTLPGLYPAQAAAWADLARDNNFDARIQQLEVTRAHTHTLKTRYATLPTFTAIASYSRGNSSYINGQDNFITGGPSAAAAQIGIQITIPLFDGLSSRSQTEENLALEDKAGDDLEVAQQTATEQAQQAYLGYEGQRSRIVALKRAVTSAQASVDFNVKAYRDGVRLNSDVLTAEDRLYSLQRNYIEARIAALVWEVKLKSVVGDLGERDIQQLNSLLDIPGEE